MWCWLAFTLRILFIYCPSFTRVMLRSIFLIFVCISFFFNHPTHRQPHTNLHQWNPDPSSPIKFVTLNCVVVRLICHIWSDPCLTTGLAPTWALAVGAGAPTATASIWALSRGAVETVTRPDPSPPVSPAVSCRLTGEAPSTWPAAPPVALKTWAWCQTARPAPASATPRGTPPS